MTALLFRRGEERTLEGLLRGAAPSNDCMIWQRAVGTDGIGRITVDYKQYGVHRYAWILAHGPIPDEATVEHLCGNKLCINVDHLALERLPTVEERFWAKVDKEGPTFADHGNCWVWTGALRVGGYGHFNAGPGTVAAHRFAYENIRGRIPDGLQLDHLCRNPPCVNPAHLEPVTGAENVRRAGPHRRGKYLKAECPRGHPYTSTTTHRRSDGFRACEVCRLQRAHERHLAAGLLGCKCALRAAALLQEAS